MAQVLSRCTIGYNKTEKLLMFKIQFPYNGCLKTYTLDFFEHYICSRADPVLWLTRDLEKAYQSLLDRHPRNRYHSTFPAAYPQVLSNRVESP